MALNNSKTIAEIIKGGGQIYCAVLQKIPTVRQKNRTLREFSGTAERQKYYSVLSVTKHHSASCITSFCKSGNAL